MNENEFNRYLKPYTREDLVKDLNKEPQMIKTEEFTNFFCSEILLTSCITKKFENHWEPFDISHIVIKSKSNGTIDLTDLLNYLRRMEHQAATSEYDPSEWDNDDEKPSDIRNFKVVTELYIRGFIPDSRQTQVDKGPDGDYPNPYFLPEIDITWFRRWK